MITISAGALLRGEVIKGLALLKFKGHLDDFLETKGFFESEFRIKGADSHARWTLNNWKRQFEVGDAH